MSRISKTDYETVTVECENCGAECIFNRREDFGHTGPYAGENVVCPFCGVEFRVVSDSINPPYEVFIFAAQESFDTKRYMQVIASMAQAWELFFATFAAAHYIYRPYFSLSEYDQDMKQLKELRDKLDMKIKKCTFYPLRNLLINTIAIGIAPTNISEATEAIVNISAEMKHDPPQATIFQVADSNIRKLLEDLFGLRVGILRNDVLHHRAYRPLRSEAEQCLKKEKCVMYHAKHAFRVGTFDEFQADCRFLNR